MGGYFNEIGTILDTIRKLKRAKKEYGCGYSNMSRKNTNQNTPHPIKDKLSQENVFFETN
jgi:hypothetical protein